MGDPRASLRRRLQETFCGPFCHGRLQVPATAERAPAYCSMGPSRSGKAWGVHSLGSISPNTSTLFAPVAR